VPYLSASAVMIHYEEALYQVYACTFTFFKGVAIPWERGKKRKTGNRFPTIWSEGDTNVDKKTSSLLCALCIWYCDVMQCRSSESTSLPLILN